MPPRSSLFALAIIALARPAAAATLGSEGDVLSLEAHGFVSQGFLLSTHDNNYLAKSSQGSFEFTEIGLNFTKPLTDDLRLGMQLFSRDLGPLGNYTLKADWFHIDYRWRDWLGLRAGRVKIPFGLYNDTSDIDVARVPVLLPQSVYPIQNRDFLLAQTGAELYGRVNLGSVSALDYRLYAGTIFLDLEQSPGSPFQIVDLGIPYVVGGRLLWEAPLEGLRLGGSVQALKLETKFLSTVGPAPKTIDYDIPAVIWVASAEYANHGLLAAAEYSRWHLEAEGSDPALVPNSTNVSERAYGMLSYRVRSWFQPGAYYSVLFPKAECKVAGLPSCTSREGRENQQHDIAATMRFDINAHWLVKLEGHFMSGTAGLSSSLNEGKPLDQLSRDWAVFMVKTTGYF